jgi:hypothetical protein
VAEAIPAMLNRGANPRRLLCFLAPEDEGAWLDIGRVKRPDAVALPRPYPDEELEMFPVSSLVIDGPDYIVRLPDQTAGEQLLTKRIYENNGDVFR